MNYITFRIKLHKIEKEIEKNNLDFKNLLKKEKEGQNRKEKLKEIYDVTGAFYSDQIALSDILLTEYWISKARKLRLPIPNKSDSIMWSSFFWDFKKILRILALHM